MKTKRDELSRLIGESEPAGMAPEKAPPDLRPLVELAATLRRLAGTPSEDQRSRMRERFRAAASRHTKRTRGPFLLGGLAAWRPHFATGVVALILLCASGLGLVEASQDTLPGERLYPLKRGVENLRLFFAFSDDARNAQRLRIAEERIEELERLHENARPAPASLYVALAQETERLTNRVGDAGQATTARTLAALTERQLRVFERVAASAEVDTSPAFRLALERARAGHDRALSVLGIEIDDGDEGSRATSGAPQEESADGQSSQDPQPASGQPAADTTEDATDQPDDTTEDATDQADDTTEGGAERGD